MNTACSIQPDIDLIQRNRENIFVSFHLKLNACFVSLFGAAKANGSPV